MDTRARGSKGPRALRLVLGSSKLRRKWWGGGSGQPCEKEGRSSKRSAKSEADEEGSDKTRVRIFQPPKKRARNFIAGH